MQHAASQRAAAAAPPRACPPSRVPPPPPTPSRRSLLASLRSLVSIDPRRIYASGFSNGAILAQRLACEATDIFAAVAPVSGL